MDREEAIEKVRQMSLPKETREIIEALAPELKSEDERIRKFLVDYFTSYKIGDVTTKLNGYRIDDILAYLEKQKDLAAIPDELVKNYKLFCENGRREVAVLINAINGISEQKEQKPINQCNTHEPTLDEARKWNEAYEKGYSLGYKNGRNEQKPAEWSDGDKHNLNSVINLVHTITDGAWGSVIGVQIENWLKSLPERFNLQPKQENDELMIKCCQKAIQFFRENAQRNEKGIRLPAQFSVGGYFATPDKVESWLKSLRPQPHKEIYQAAKHDLAIKFMNYLDENRPEGKMSLSNAECEDIDKAFKENDLGKIIRYANKYSWKPSEEQMCSLRDTILNTKGYQYSVYLPELYDDLKNL